MVCLVFIGFKFLIKNKNKMIIKFKVKFIRIFFFSENYRILLFYDFKFLILNLSDLYIIWGVCKYILLGI